jgi:hypothetical protein
MADSGDCRAQVVNGVMKCITHGVNLEERQALESRGISVEQPQVGGLFCPISLRQFSSADPLWDKLEQG